MTNQAFSGIAALVALTFLAMALHGCASPAQSAAEAVPTATVAIPEASPGVAEFHGAHIARDLLRDRLPSES